MTIFTIYSLLEYWCVKALEDTFSKKKAVVGAPSNIDVVSKLKSPSNQMWQSLRLVTTADDSSVSRPVCCLDTGAGAGGGNQYSVLTKNVRGVNRPSWLPGPRWAG